MSGAAKLGIVGAILSLLSGCVIYEYVPTVPVEAGELVRVMPQPVKNRVHVLFVHGHDPLDLAGLSDLRQYLVSLGLIKTYAGGPYCLSELCDAAGQSHLREPNAKFVLVGHGTGCASLPYLASCLNGRDIPVALVVCLDPEPKALQLIEGVGRIVSVVRSEGTPAPGDVHIVPAKYLGVPKEAQTREILMRELAAVAQQVEVVENHYGPVPMGGEWGFLGGPGPEFIRGLPIREAREMGPATMGEQ
jgi:hypothetical protein